MLELKQDLPSGVLLDNNRDGFAEGLKDTGAVWFSGSWDAFGIDDASGAIACWHSADGQFHAHPTDPNNGHGLLADVGAHAGLRCIPEVNCGLAVPEITQNAATFTMAVIYQPVQDVPAKTLLTVNTGSSGKGDQNANYLFLSDGGDFFIAKDVRGSVDLTVPVTGSSDGLRMAIVTLAGDTLALAESLNAPATMQGVDAGMRTAADLFIGCRSHRGGLQKTLGASIIVEVLFWPRHALLLPRNDADEAQYLNLKRYFLWGH